MKSWAREVGLWLALIMMIVGDKARADTPPDAWDIAKMPATRPAYALHVRVDRLLHPPSDGTDLGLDVGRMREVRLETVKAMLEDGIRQAGDASSRLRADLGIVLEALATLDQRIEGHGRVVELLAPLVEEAGGLGGDPAPLEALASAYAWLDRPQDEVPVWRRYVAELTDDRRRVSPLVNLGEAEMRLGDLTGATDEFRRAIDICEELAGSASLDEDYALALWDLSVALDRKGDIPVALEVVRRAKHWTWLEIGPMGLPRKVTGWDLIRDHADVYFVPAWEREWYLAMGEEADAETVPEAIARAGAWASAEEHWSAYLTGAEPQVAARVVGVRAGSPELGTESRAPGAVEGVSLLDAERRWIAMARLRLAHAHAKCRENERSSGRPSSGESLPTKLGTRP